MDFGKMDNASLLTEINKAILTILNGGQSYKIGSRQLTRADLAELNRMKINLESQENTNGGNLFGNTVVAFFDGR